jgi:hypothetical protein
MNRRRKSKPGGIRFRRTQLSSQRPKLRRNQYFRRAIRLIFQCGF